MFDYEKKMDLCAKCMALEFGIPEHTAWVIINNLNLEEIMFDYYKDQINESEYEKKQEWESEKKMNPDIYGGI